MKSFQIAAQADECFDQTDNAWAVLLKTNILNEDYPSNGECRQFKDLKKNKKRT